MPTFAYCFLRFADAVLRCCPAVLEGAKAGRVPSEGLTNAFGMFLQNELSFAGTGSLDSSWEEERRAQAACELLLCLPGWLCCPTLPARYGRPSVIAPCDAHAVLHVACTSVLSPEKERRKGAQLSYPHAQNVLRPLFALHQAGQPNFCCRVSCCCGHGCIVSAMLLRPQTCWSPLYPRAVGDVQLQLSE